MSEKASKGDAAATQELATIGQELQKITPEVAATLNNLTPEQKAKYEALVKKALEQAQKQQAK